MEPVSYTHLDVYKRQGVYFKEIVKAPGALAILGYTSFMITMAIGRFLSDVLVRKFGSRNVILTSGFVISIGLYCAVLFPYLIPVSYTHLDVYKRQIRYYPYLSD